MSHCLPIVPQGDEESDTEEEEDKALGKYLHYPRAAPGAQWSSAVCTDSLMCLTVCHSPQGDEESDTEEEEDKALGKHHHYPRAAPGAQWSSAVCTDSSMCLTVCL